MKNASLVINGVLFVAVLVLYILHFTGNKNTATNHVVRKDTTGMSLSDSRVAYVNIDSVFNNYTLFSELEQILITKQTDAQGQMQYLSTSLEQEMTDFQEKYQRGLLTTRQAQQTQEQLVTKQNNLVALNDRYTNELMVAEMSMNKTLYDSIYSYLKDYTAVNGYDYVIKNGFGGTLLYANDAFDITADVLEGLNQRYMGSDAAKKDTTATK